MNWQCNNPKCLVPCKLDVDDSADPWYCPFGLNDNCKWQKSKEKPVEVFEAIAQEINPNK